MADSGQPENKLIPGEPSKLEGQSLSRLAAARTWKSYIELDVKEAYFFSAPNRQRQISSMTQPGTQRMLDAPELNTDIAFLVTQDFVTEVTNAFMPEALEWCERGPGMDLPDGVWDKIKKDVNADDKRIFGAMKASNLYPEVTKAFYPDLAIGTVGMWIQRPHPSRPISVAAIPFRELEVNLGPYGEIDDRFAVRYTRNSYVRELVGEEIWGKITAEMKREIDEKPTTRTQVVWGFWRLWDDHTDECWQHVVLVSDKLVHDAELKGEGCCPLLAFRFNPTADWPHGTGPLIQGLPTLRQIDELERLRIKHSALAIAPPITYPDDSFAAVEQGVEEDMAYPVRPGTAGDVQPMYKVTPPDAANYQYEEKVKVLRKLFFVDMPEQHGDTPPTLGQWLDEMARAQRRIGTPGLPFWREGPANIFLRFKYLLEVSGAIKPVQVDGRAIATLPRNPAQAAAEQQEVGMAVKAIQILGQAFPEEFKMYIDGAESIKAILDKMRVTLLKLRKPDQVKAAVAQMAQLAGARHVAGAPDQPPGPAS
jgi:hypothetical protein